MKDKPGVSRHHSAERGLSKNNVCLKMTRAEQSRAERRRETYLLPGPRLPRAELDVARNQLVSSCRQQAKREKKKGHR